MQQKSVFCLCHKQSINKHRFHNLQLQWKNKQTNQHSPHGALPLCSLSLSLCMCVCDSAYETNGIICQTVVWDAGPISFVLFFLTFHLPAHENLSFVFDFIFPFHILSLVDKSKVFGTHTHPHTFSFFSIGPPDICVCVCVGPIFTQSICKPIIIKQRRGRVREWGSMHGLHVFLKPFSPPLRFVWTL